MKYIQSLKQVDPTFDIPEFIPSSKVEKFVAGGIDEEQLDGKALYIKNCASCHQPSGEGLAGALMDERPAVVAASALIFRVGKPSM